MIGAHALDLSTTLSALSHPGMREANPPTRPASRAAGRTCSRQDGDCRYLELERCIPGRQHHCRSGRRCDYLTNYVTSMDLASGPSNGTQVTVTFNAASLGLTGNQTIIFNGTANNAGGVIWDCTGGALLDKYRPANCR